jgi:hypothetical protein
MTFHCHAFAAVGIFGTAALAATIECSHTQAFAGVSEAIYEITAVAGIPVELEDSGTGSIVLFGTHIFCVDSRSTYARKPEIKRLTMPGYDSGRGNKLGLGISRVELAQGFIPVLIEVGRAGIAALVFVEFCDGFIDERHL